MPNTQETERKDFRYSCEFKGASLEEQTISGAAAVIGNMDSYGDVIFPGAFKSALKDFLRAGFVPDTHGWHSMAQLVAMPKAAKEVGRELQCVAKFHGTEYAQSVRQICQERLAEGLSVGLSIGFSIDYGDDESRMWFESGSQMLKYMKDVGADMNLFDVPSIKAWGEHSCRAIFKVKELFEFSPVPVPANRSAVAMSVKQFALDDGPLAGLSLDEHSNSVLAAVRGLADRVASLKALREGEGRSLSDVRRSEIEELKGLLDGLLTSTEPSMPPGVAPDLQLLHLRRQRAMTGVV